jgi:hypothetical protein
MSYRAAAALQRAVFDLLTGAPALSGVAVVDALPAGGGAGTFVLIGPEEVRDASDQTGMGAEHRFAVSVVSDASGFLAAKTVAAHVAEVLVEARPVLGEGRVVGIHFLRARAERREGGLMRRIDLVFRARIEL